MKNMFQTICRCVGGHTGRLIDIDEQKVVLSLIDKYYHVLINGQVLPPHLVLKFVNAFPEHGSYFRQSR